MAPQQIAKLNINIQLVKAATLSTVNSSKEGTSGEKFARPHYKIAQF